MLGNMHKMAAPSGLPSGYFIGPQLLNQSSDFNFVFTIILRKTFLFHTKFVDSGWSTPKHSGTMTPPPHKVCTFSNPPPPPPKKGTTYPPPPPKQLNKLYPPPPPARFCTFHTPTNIFCILIPPPPPRFSIVLIPPPPPPPDFLIYLTPPLPEILFSSSWYHLHSGDQRGIHI